MFNSAKTLSLNETRIFRFTLGVVLSIAISFAFNWPLAFITPIFVAKFLASEKPAMPLKAYAGILVVILIGLFSGMLITQLFLDNPVVFMLVMTVLMFWIAYWSNNGGNEFAIAMLIIGLTLVPMLGLIHHTVSAGVITGFIISCVVALFITLIMQHIIADPVEVNAKPDDITPELTVNHKIRLSALSTAIIMPAVIVFFVLDMTDALLVLVFIANLALKPDQTVGVKGSTALLLGNALGGVLAILAYSVLLVIPTYTALLFIFTLLALFIGKKIFSGGVASILYGIAMSTVIILVASSGQNDVDAGDKFVTRIFQIGCACAYIIMATSLTQPFLAKFTRDNRSVQP